MQASRSHIAFLMNRPARAVTCAALAVALTATPALLPLQAHALSSSTEYELSETQQEVEKATKAYEEAQGNLAALQQKIDENTASIAELEALLPEQRQRASAAMRDLYKYQKSSNTLMGIVLQTTSFDEAISTVAYMNQIQESSNAELERLTALESELETKRTELDQAKAKASAEEQAAAEALAEAQELRSAAQAKAERERAEEAARLAADTSAASGTGADAGNGSNTADTPGQSIGVEVSGSVNWNVTYDEFMAEWTPRIDAYLSGSPLAGYGSTFADAAWNSSVDPRWSPAIACIESTKGAYTFRPYNAWGWMTSRRFGSWDESIRAHVSFLGSVYGATLTPAAAQKYCPPTWQDWYNKVGGQMSQI